MCDTLFKEPTDACLSAAADRAGRAVPPAWPLAASVAVNPFLGQVHEDLATVSARLSRVAGATITMPRAWYAARIASGAIIDADLQGALACTTSPLRPADVASLKAAAQTSRPRSIAAPTIADLAAEVSGIDWPSLFNDRFGAWAAGYFDQGQALWAAPRGTGAYGAWRAVATHDLTPEIIGLTGFASFVSQAPETAPAALAQCAEKLQIPKAAFDTYFHQMLVTLGGWAQYGRYRVWQAELDGEVDTVLTDLLAIRLLWDAALFERYQEQIAARWQAVVALHASPVAADADDVLDAILQEATERAAQRGLAKTLAAPKLVRQSQVVRPVLQAVFCIDVRSEVFRRALESVHPDIRTIGFAGFFGVGISHQRFASDVSEHRLPVLLKSGLTSRAGSDRDAALDVRSRLKARAKRAWGRFKLAAVSSFAFVEATGPTYAVKLIQDALGMRGSAPKPQPEPHFVTDLSLAQRVQAAETALRAMSLTSRFARLVIIAGHGASVTNNPHASSLHCGACGGYSGEVNARLAAALFNDPEVRFGLMARGIEVPADTVFVAALHDTTTDIVQLYGDHQDLSGHQQDLQSAQVWFEAAGARSREERALRLSGASGEGSLVRRSRDWAEVRPEWGLAGCKAFIAAPRRRTAAKTLEGRAFLHDYDWRRDEGFGVLELILTAPVVVASWISLQYYGSAVAPDLFGAGNKLLHNVVGGIGVVEGNGGQLRAGLPWQSVHDGQGFAHEPLRLSVCVEAPREAINGVLERHEAVRALFDNRWLHLFALDDAGQMAWRYEGGLNWSSLPVSVHL